MQCIVVGGKGGSGNFCGKVGEQAGLLRSMCEAIDDGQLALVPGWLLSMVYMYEHASSFLASPSSFQYLQPTCKTTRMLAYWSIKMYKFQCGWPHHKTGHCGVRTPTCAPHFSTTSSWEAVGMSSTAKRGELNSSDHSELGRQGLRGV